MVEAATPEEATRGGRAPRRRRTPPPRALTAPCDRRMPSAAAASPSVLGCSRSATSTPVTRPAAREWYDVWRAGQSHRPAGPDPVVGGRRASRSRRDRRLRAPALRCLRRTTTLVGVEPAQPADGRQPHGRLRRRDGPSRPPAARCRHGGARRAGASGARRGPRAGAHRGVRAPGGDGGGSAFAEARGYAVANREGVKAVDLAAAEPGWPALEDQVAAALGDYRVVTWRDRCPDEYVDGFGAALSRVMSLIPQGDLDLEDREWTVERVRAAEERRVEIGLATFESVAVAPDGTVVGLTGVRVSTARPADRSHRRHHGAARAPRPPARARDQAGQPPRPARGVPRAAGSWSPATPRSTTHMNAINEAMGYQRASRPWSSTTSASESQPLGLVAGAHLLQPRVRAGVRVVAGQVRTSGSSPRRCSWGRTRWRWATRRPG